MAASMKVGWRVVGGINKGGILVRAEQDLKSEEAPERLSTGSIVEQLDLAGDRLRYRLVLGTGPPEGWVSLKISGKELLVPEQLASAPAEEVAPAPAEEAASSSFSVDGCNRQSVTESAAPAEEAAPAPAEEAPAEEAAPPPAEEAASSSFSVDGCNRQSVTESAAPAEEAVPAPAEEAPAEEAPAEEAAPVPAEEPAPAPAKEAADVSLLTLADEWHARLRAALAAPPAIGSTKDLAPWLRHIGKPPADTRLRLIVFSWTGNRGGAGSSHSFARWPAQFFQLSPSRTWEILEVALPGRGQRQKEPCVTDHATIAGAVAAAIVAVGPPAAVVLFGFSFGAVLAFETAQLLMQRGQPPLGLVVASAEPPTWPGRACGVGPSSKSTRSLSEAAFEQVLRDKGGTDVLLKTEELKNMFMPVIRADIEMEEAYGAAPPPHVPLSCPIVVFRGARCPQVSRADAEAWLSFSHLGSVAPSRVEELDTGLKPTADAPWLSDWYVLQAAPSAAAIVAAIARDFAKRL
eukprot:NODE_3001_length_2107_cov_11.119697.p1 GENE.NODE_3001_length_2107_cov_11.119697~~NODE_3001_length_2107_cov_11.119697.p1  ORF type:complete len:519 (-),score=182.15 NODE_3001_length_2107_cov_11.119697:482-2038(-)